MAIEGLERYILDHPFFSGLDEGFGRFICTCAQNVVFQAGDYLCRESERADRLYLLRHGSVALEIAVPGRTAMTFQTVESGEIVGASWLVPPYRWNYDARALELVRAVAMDAECLRGKIEQDHKLGYELMTRFVPVLISRLNNTRLQMLDIYSDA